MRIEGNAVIGEFDPGDFAEAEAVRLGRNAITLYTNALMTRNIAIYAARGYVERERKIEKGFDRVYMVKSLTPG